jgi:hypothetical protein
MPSLLNAFLHLPGLRYVAIACSHFAAEAATAHRWWGRPLRRSSTQSRLPQSLVPTVATHFMLSRRHWGRRPPPPRASPLPICYASRLPPRYTTHHPRGASLTAKVLRPPLSTEVPLLPRVLHFSVISFAPLPPHAWWPSPLPACSSSLRMPGRLRRPPFAYQKCTLLLETMTNDLMT